MNSSCVRNKTWWCMLSSWSLLFPRTACSALLVPQTFTNNTFFYHSIITVIIEWHIMDFTYILCVYSHVEWCGTFRKQVCSVYIIAVINLVFLSAASPFFSSLLMVICDENADCHAGHCKTFPMAENLQRLQLYHYKFQTSVTETQSWQLNGSSKKCHLSNDYKYSYRYT